MPRVPLRRVALATSAALLAGVPLGTPAQAASGVGFELTPAGSGAYPRFDARPGQVLRGAVRLKSRSTKDRAIRLQALDLATADTGGIEFVSRRPKRARTWLRLERRDLRLPARGRVTVAFTARVPAGAASGEHFAGIVAVDRAQLRRAAARRAAGGGTVMLREVTRLALPVRFRLPGRSARRLDVAGAAFAADASGGRLELDLRSTGGRLVRSTDVRLDVLHEGKRLFTHRAEITDFVPRTRISYPIALRGQAQRGDYRVTGTIRPRGGPAVRVDEKVAFTAPQADRLEDQTGQPAPGTGLPLLLIGALGAAVVLAATASIAYLRLRRRLAAATEA